MASHAVAPVTRLARWIDRGAWALTNSWTYHLYGMDHLRQAVRASPSRTVMLVLWHQDLLLLAGAVRGKGMRLAALVSRSGDGTLIAHHLEQRGVATVRGSSRKGAVSAARGLLEVGAQGRHLCIAIDGPMGPAKQTRTGPLEIARNLGLPVVPIAARATREWLLPTWDRGRIPWPRAHVAITFGEAMHLTSEDRDEARLEDLRRVLARRLLALGADAADRCGQPDRDPPARWTRWLQEPPASGT